VQDILKQNADDLGTPGWDSSYGYGRINAARAVNAAIGGSGADTNSPTVNIVSPANGATVSGIITAQVSAADNIGVVSVNLSVDGNSLGTNASSPFGFSWNTTTVINGSHTLLATARDAAGNASSFSVTVMVSNTPAPSDAVSPTITITSPAGGAKVSANVSVLVNATDNVGVVKNELYVDGVLTSSSTSAPFTNRWNTKKVSAGAHLLQCKAFDAAGNVGFSQIVTVYK